MDETLLNDLPSVGSRLRVSRSTVFNEIRDGRLRVVKIGRRSFVTEEELNRYVRALSTATAEDGNAE